ncbi:hypothetical protein CMUS01_07886 [Colletotrichum musicola]|uniref:Uncharacterized protein n=1 Tax=Colletotrichum musicola TaxID=2175873 RepID=A0A8H6KG36_9PEZI|nr:hypothetical protein CMUS01_07886 [Colletotrichum musicola]
MRANKQNDPIRRQRGAEEVQKHREGSIECNPSIQRTRLMTGDNRKAASCDVLVLVQQRAPGGYAFRTGQSPASILSQSSSFAGGQRPATTMIPPDYSISNLDSPKNESQPIVPAVRGGSLTLRERAVANRASPCRAIPPVDGWEEHDWLKTFKRCRFPGSIGPLLRGGGRPALPVGMASFLREKPARGGQTAGTWAERHGQ